MKKVLFSLAFIAATLTSCLTDKPALNYEGNGAVDVTIGINVPELATRAGETGMNSGLGAIDNFSEDEWAKYDLRYIFEVYDVTPGYENFEKPVKERLVKTFDQYSETKFELRLIPDRTYKFVVWADFVNEGSEDDLNYNTANLKNITRKGEASAMDESMDAYFIQQDIEVKATHKDNLVLTRPFGKIRVIATDVNEVNIGSTPAKVDVTFYNHPVFVSLNALSGKTETTVETVTYSYDIAKGQPYSEGYDAYDANQTLFADYIFAQPQAYGEQEVNFTMKVTEKDGRIIREHDFNTQIPLKRNHLTTIMGNLLTTATEFNVSINDDFDGETPINVNPDAPKPTTFVFTYAEVSPNYNSGWGDFNIDFYTDNSDLLSLNLFGICSDNFIPEGTYDVKPTSGCIYTEYYSYFNYNGETHQFNSFGTVTVSVVNDQYVITMSGLQFTDGTEFNGTFTGWINGLDTTNSGNQGGNVEENTGYKVYATTELGWEYMDIWIWNDTGNLASNPNWPGDAMETEVVDGEEYFVYTLPAGIQTYNLVFSTDWGNVQTVDYTNIIADRDRFFLITNETYDNKYIVKDITDNGNEGGNEGGEEGAVELSIVSHDFGYTADMETEVIFICDDGNQHIVDFRMNGIEAGTYNDYDNSIILGYCRYMHGNVDYNGGNGVVFDSANATIVDNGDTTFTFDVTFVAEGATFHFTYTTPSSEPVVYDPWTCSYTYTGSPISGATFTFTGTGENQDVIVIESVKAALHGTWLDVTATRGDVVGSGKAYISYEDTKCRFDVTIGNVTYRGETGALF